jgi:hypothetical protein
MQEKGLFISCYDGNPSTQDLSEGRCATVDLSKPISFAQHDWVLSLEVGEHIPKEYENVFISNLKGENKEGVILSWAIEGQGGKSHVNEKSNDYIRRIFEEDGYTSDYEIEKQLRDLSTLPWFKNTIMVFRRIKENSYLFNFIY